MRKEPFLYVIAFVVDGCFALLGICVPLLAMGIGATYDDLGAISATSALTYALGCFVGGNLTDRIGYRRFMIVASLGIALVCVSYLAVDQLWQLFALAGLTGAMMSGFWPPLQAWLGVGKDRGQLLQVVGRFNVCWSLGILIGPVLGGTLYAVDPSRVFTLAAALMGMIFVFVLRLPVREEAATERKEVGRPGSLALARRFLPVAWIANFATFFATGTVRSLFPKLATDLGIDPALLGKLLGLIGLMQVIFFFFIARTDRWQFKLAPLIGIQLMAVVGLGILTLGSSQIYFAFGLLCQGALIGTTFTSSAFYSLHAEGPGGKRTGIHEGLIGSGMLVGPLAGGLMAEHVGPRAPYLLAIGVLFCAIVVEIYLVNRKRY
ncbi:MAG: MFS transporter [Gemmatimonadetes bacterium]|nr:MFS transporter [Gemmatimonadota bacterium]